jgi:hypothetical protein
MNRLQAIAKAPQFPFLVALALYAALRIALLPTDGPLSGGFSHDSAYIAIVADEVRNGHGYVNPASWLVFLNPPDLPMPFHNANPGYVTLIAVFSKLFGADLFWSGFLISALSNVLLAAAVYLLVMPLSGSRVFAALCAGFTALFPANMTDSLNYLPDALTTALTILCFAFLVRQKYVWAGCFFGLAWLCRSTAVLCIPGILVYIVYRLNRTPAPWNMAIAQVGWAVHCGPQRAVDGASSRYANLLRFGLGQSRATMRALLGFGLASFVVASPWLAYTARVWGSPLRSDGTFYLLQNYYAEKSTQGDVARYWRTLTPPPSLTEVLRTDAPGLVRHTIKGIPVLFRNTLFQWAGGSKPKALLLLLLLGLGAVWSRKLLLTPEGLAAAVICLATFGVLCVRADSIEVRYLGPCTVLLFLWPLASLRHWSFQSLTRPGWAQGTTAVAAAAVLLVAWPLQDWKAVQQQRGINPATARTRTLALEVNESYAKGARVVARGPYFYTLFTGASALNVPYAPKRELLDYMRHYRAPFLLLDKQSTEISCGQLAPELRVRAEWQDEVLLELNDTL